MSSIIILPILGIVMMISLILTALTGMGLIKAGFRMHRFSAFFIIGLSFIHGIYGWILFFPYPGPNLIAGSILFLFFMVSILSGTVKRKVFQKQHRILGVATLCCATAHGIFGLITSLGMA